MNSGSLKGVSVALVFLSLHTLPASAQNCPELEQARQRLTEFRQAKSRKTDELQALEATGPQTIGDLDRLNALRNERPAQIKAEREQFERDMAARRARVTAERDRRNTDLTRQRDQLSARNEADLAAQQAKYSDLVLKGAMTGDLEARIRDASARKSGLQVDKDRVLSDLRRNKFCSECRRSAYEIEKSEAETFEQHLVRVRGHGIMMPEEIQKRSDAFDRQIQQAQQEEQQARNALNTARNKHDQSVRDTLAAITKLRVDGPAAITALQQQIDGNRRDGESAISALDAAIGEGRNKFAGQETARAQEEQELDAAIAEKTATHNAKAGELRDALARDEGQETQLKAAFLDASNNCKSVVIEAQQQVTENDNTLRRAFHVAKQTFANASYQNVYAHEAARRAALDNGGLIPVEAAAPRVSALESAMKRAGDMVSTVRKRWNEGLGMRETSFYRELDPTVRKKIDANLETLTSPTNTVRAVLRDSIGRLRSDSTTALLRNALGEGKGLAPELAAAFDIATPSLGASIKKRLMPTLEATAIETVVNARERQQGRSFNPEDRIMERTEVRVWSFLFDRQKLGEALTESVTELFDLHQQSASRDMGEEK